MKLDPKDRRMLAILLALVALVIVLVAVFAPKDDSSRNTIPFSYAAGAHGAKAAFLMLEQSGYRVERWEKPLADLADRSDLAGPEIVLILAGPLYQQEADRNAIAAILKKGGRVLATGIQGGSLLPGNEVAYTRQVSFAACHAYPDGLAAAPGPIWIVPSATWKESRPDFHTLYTCARQPVVVEYPVGKGTATWWASSTPLENGSIARGQNLELLLDSLGPPQNRRIFWDESLHASPASQWSFVNGPIWPLLLFGFLGLALLVILSFSRRSGPVRALPQSPRTTPIEFLEALGALYRSTGANATALQIAWERFRAQAALLTGQRSPHLDAAQLSAAIERRFGSIAKQIAPDLAAAEEACWEESLKPRRALALVQALRRHEETLHSASAHGISDKPRL